MAARGGLTRKEMKHDEFIEAATDAGEWLEQNWKKVAIAVVVVLAAALGTFGAVQWNRARAAEAREALAEGMRQFGLAENGEPDGSYEEALRVFGDLAGRGDSVGRVAEYYRGITLLRTGKAGEAVEAFEKVRTGAEDDLLRQSAAVVLADALAQEGKTDRAVEILRGVADAGGVYPGEAALVQAGRILRESGNVVEARRTWQSVVERYPQSLGAQEAQQLLDQSAPLPDLR